MRDCSLTRPSACTRVCIVSAAGVVASGGQPSHVCITGFDRRIVDPTNLIGVERGPHAQTSGPPPGRRSSHDTGRDTVIGRSHCPGHYGRKSVTSRRAARHTGALLSWKDCLSKDNGLQCATAQVPRDYRNLDRGFLSSITSEYHSGLSSAPSTPTSFPLELE
jgi:hypothetical protein